MWRDVTWEQFARAMKFLAGLAWGTLELWQWGGRGVPLAFIGSVIAGTEGAQLYMRLRSLEQRGSSPTGSSSPQPPLSSEPSSPG